MKTRFLGRAGVMVACIAFLSQAGCRQQLADSQSPPVKIVDDALVLKSADDPAAVDGPEPSLDSEVVKGSVAMLSEYKPLPEGLTLSVPAGDLLALVRSGSEQPLLLAYISNAVGIFDLGAEQIIYFNDIGVPGKVITAMLEHDHAQARVNWDEQAVNNYSANPPSPLVTETPAYEENAPASDFPAQGAPAVLRVNYSLPSSSLDLAENEPVWPEPVPTADDSAAAVGEPSLNGFYSTLAPYGAWMQVEGVGRCWQPAVAARDSSWQPYFDRGHWVYSDCGWYWLSDYSWGWAAFHYGRWFRHESQGWCWRPDKTWGPSWVCWRTGPAICGWAPLPPGAAFRRGHGWTFEGKTLSGACDFHLTPATFRFINLAALREHNLKPHQIPHSQLTQGYAQTTPGAEVMDRHHHTVIGSIPSPHRGASRATRQDVAAVPVQELRRIPGQDRSLETVERPSGNIAQRGGFSGLNNRRIFPTAIAAGSAILSVNDHTALSAGAPALTGGPLPPAIHPSQPSIHSAPSSFANRNAFLVQRSSRGTVQVVPQPADPNPYLLVAPQPAPANSTPFWLAPSRTTQTQASTPHHGGHAEEPRSSPVSDSSNHHRDVARLSENSAHLQAVHHSVPPPVEHAHQHAPAPVASEAPSHTHSAPAPPPVAAHVEAPVSHSRSDDSSSSSHGQRR